MTETEFNPEEYVIYHVPPVFNADISEEDRKRSTALDGSACRIRKKLLKYGYYYYELYELRGQAVRGCLLEAIDGNPETLSKDAFSELLDME